MQRLEVSGAVRLIYRSLGFKGLNVWAVVPSLWFMESLDVVRLCACSPVHKAAVQPDKAADTAVA
jgi:hypothetical protein